MTTGKCKHSLEFITNRISRHFFDRRMGQEIDGEVLGDEFKGYVFKITGGNDKQGFPMKQGVMVNGRVRLLMKKSKYIYSSPLLSWLIYLLIQNLNSFK